MPCGRASSSFYCVLDDVLALPISKSLRDYLLQAAVTSAAREAIIAGGRVTAMEELLVGVEDVKAQAGRALGLAAKAPIGQVRKELVTRGHRALAKEVVEYNQGRRWGFGS